MVWSTVRLHVQEEFACERWEHGRKEWDMKQLVGKRKGDLLFIFKKNNSYIIALYFILV